MLRWAWSGKGWSGRAIATAALLALLSCSACGSGPSDPPMAVIQASPAAICEGDDYQTVIGLDGRRSTSGLVLLPGPPDPDEEPLEFRWRLEGADHRIESGSLRAPALGVSTAGDRPLHVWLTVRNGAGEEATALATVALTLDCGGVP
jgi:hypothetical protein